MLVSGEYMTCPFVVLFVSKIFNFKKTFRLIIPETNIFAPENGWLEYDRFLLGSVSAYFQGLWLLVLGSVIPKVMKKKHGENL